LAQVALAAGLSWAAKIRLVDELVQYMVSQPGSTPLCLERAAEKTCPCI